MRFALRNLWRALFLGLAVTLALPACNAPKTTGGTPAAKDKEAEKDETEKDKEAGKEKDKDPGKPPPKDPG